MRSEPTILGDRLTILEAGFLLIVGAVVAAEVGALTWIAGIIVGGT